MIRGTLYVIESYIYVHNLRCIHIFRVKGGCVGFHMLTICRTQCDLTSRHKKISNVNVVVKLRHIKMYELKQPIVFFKTFFILNYKKIMKNLAQNHHHQYQKEQRDGKYIGDCKHYWNLYND